MIRLITCVCGASFPNRRTVPSDVLIGEHVKTCPESLAIKKVKKDKQHVSIQEELYRFKTSSPPCMCTSNYEKTRRLFNMFDGRIFSEIDQVFNKIIYIDFPNFNTRKQHNQMAFVQLILSMWNSSNQFKIYMKGIHKNWFLMTINIMTVPAAFLSAITVYVVNSAKAPVSRDDILMLKNVSLDDQAVIPIHGTGEKYRDIGYHINTDEHTSDCRAMERYGSSKAFKWSSFTLRTDVNGKAIYDKNGDHKCEICDTVINSFNSNITFIKV